MYISNSNKAKIFYIYFENPETGKINCKSLRTKDRSEAESLLESFKKPDGNKLSDIKQNLFLHIRQNNSYNTYRSYLLTYNHLIRIIGDRLILEVDKNAIGLFKSVRITEVKNISVNIDIRNIKAIFNKLVSLGLIEYSKVSSVKQLKISEKNILTIDRKDLSLILDNISNTQMKNIVKLSLYTANRISETLNIKGKDIDLSNHILSVYQFKSNKYKYIPITQNIIGILSEITYSKDGYLFHKHGFPCVKLRCDYVSRYFKKILKQLNLNPMYKFHCLRHTAITELIRNNVPVAIVKEIAGHSSINTTMLYVHINLEDLRKGLSTLEF